MRDCLNVEIREMLPEQAAGSLQGDSERRVAEHLVECVDCVEELAVLRSARSVLLRAPAVDVSRIAAGVTAATRTHAAAPVGARRRWVGLRAAAALLVVAAGATSVVLWNDGADTGVRSPAAALAQNSPAESDGLALTGGFADLSDAEVEVLMNDIEDLDADYALEPEATLPSLAIGELGGA